MFAVREYTDGTLVIQGKSRDYGVPTEEACYKRLIKLLEDAGGNAKTPLVAEFWDKITSKCSVPPAAEEAEAEYFRRTYERMQAAWERIHTPPQKQLDVFDIMDDLEEECSESSNISSEHSETPNVDIFAVVDEPLTYMCPPKPDIFSSFESTFGSVDST